MMCNITGLELIYILQAPNVGTCISHLWLWARWPILSCWPTQKPPLATANKGKTQVRFWGEKKKEKVYWQGRYKLAREKFVAVGIACMALYWPTPGFQRRTFVVWVPNRWDLHFCICSSPLQEVHKYIVVYRIHVCYWMFKHNLKYSTNWKKEKDCEQIPLNTWVHIWIYVIIIIYHCCI